MDIIPIKVSDLDSKRNTEQLCDDEIFFFFFTSALKQFCANSKYRSVCPFDTFMNHIEWPISVQNKEKAR